MLRRSFIFFSLCLLSSVFLFEGCSKGEKEGEQEQYVFFEVREYKTNIPLAGVQIKLYRCSEYDIEFGCIAEENFATVITNQEGMASVDKFTYYRCNEGVVFSKAGYFSINAGAGTAFLNKQGTVDIRIVPGSTDYSGKRLVILAYNDRYNFQVLDPIPVPTVPVDMTIKAIDALVNTLKWEIRGGSFGGGTIIKRGEIPNITIPYNGRVTTNL